ncbi:MAG: hypothetical protein WCF16_10475 [Alphaproteobacteria bacterium]
MARCRPRGRSCRHVLDPSPCAHRNHLKTHDFFWAPLLHLRRQFLTASLRRGAGQQVDIQGIIASQAATAPERKPPGDPQAMQAAFAPAAPIAPAAATTSLPAPTPAAGTSAPVGFLELARAAQATPAVSGSNGLFRHGLFGDDGFGFDDVLDIINPLQHIPIVSSIYRALTGDHIDAGPRMIGGAILGGGLGFASAAINAVIEDQTGKDLGEHVVAALFGEPEDTKTQPVQFAAADPGDANATDQAQADAAKSAGAAPDSKPHGSVGITPWYLAGTAPVPATGEPDVAKGEGPQIASSALAPSPQNEIAAIEPAAGPQDEPPQPIAGVGGRLHPLTKVQLALLSQHETLSDDATGGANAAASLAAVEEPGVAAPGELFPRSTPQGLAAIASPGPGGAALSQPGTPGIPELTTEQLSLLLSSVGANEPPPIGPATATTAPPNIALGTAPGTENEAKASTPVDAESAAAAAATAKRPAPVTALPLARPFTNRTPSGAFAAAGVRTSQPDPAVAQKMLRGLDQYFKNPRGVNPHPLHVDMIR